VAAPWPTSGETISCEVSPDQTEGPYYFDPALTRRDIREAQLGSLVRVELRFLALTTCRPLDQMPVELWHANALGIYSGYPGQGADGSVDTSTETFLRGMQLTDDTGLVVFETVYPGQYPGRCPHLHIRAHVGDRVFTSQVYFSDEQNQATRQESPYSTNAVPLVLNETDRIFVSSGGKQLVGELRELGSGRGRAATLNLTV
jgi:protocatechuate 3,4-dioxygenase beta subunit